MHFQATFYAFERADGLLYGLRLQSIGEGDGCSRDAVLGVHPAGRSHADVLQDTAGILEVVVEIPALVGAGVQRAEIGPLVGIVIGEHACACIFRADGRALFGNHRARHLTGESLEGLHHVCIVSVDVQMVGIHRRNDGNLREQLQERAVKLIGLHHHGLVPGHQEVGAVVSRNAAEESAAALSCFCKDMCRER